MLLHRLLILLVCPISKVSGLGLWASDYKIIVLEDIESIILEKPIESEKLEKAVADFNALWAYRVGNLLTVEKPTLFRTKGIYLRQSKSDIFVGKLLFRKKRSMFCLIIFTLTILGKCTEEFMEQNTQLMQMKFQTFHMNFMRRNAND